MKLVITEKPSVAKSISAVLGADKRRDGYFEDENYLVSWCFGHLAELASAEVYDEAYARWSREQLPIIPESWQYSVGRDKKKQLELLKKYGYQVVTVQRLMEYSPFADVGREDPGFEKLVRLQKTRGIVYSDNRLRLDAPMTWGELAMLLAPRGEAIDRRIQKIRETGTAQHANWGAMDWCAEQGILKYAMDPDGAVSSLPSAYFAPAKGFTRRQVYEAFRE